MIASTLSGTCKKESSCPTSVLGRSLLLRKSSRASRLTRQCLPTFRHGRFPSRHQRQMVVSFTPISPATSSALSRSFSSCRPMFPHSAPLSALLPFCSWYRLFAELCLLYLTLVDFAFIMLSARLPNSADMRGERKGSHE